MKPQKKERYFYLSSVVACIILSMAAMSVTWAKEKIPEVSSDGLHLIKDAKVRIAYAKPGMTLDQYTQVKILDCFVQFKKNWERDFNMNEVGLEGRVTDKDAVAIKLRLATEFNKVFTKELTKAGHSVAEDAGADVLLLRPAIINLDVTAPDTMRVGMSTSYVASAGQMTLFLELYDSSTSTLLARVIDPEAGQGGGIAMQANRVTNTAEADRILSRWAKLLIDHLGDVKQNVSAP